MPNIAVMLHSSIALIVKVRPISIIELCGITALLGIFFETNKHQNLKRLRQPIDEAPQPQVGCN